MRFEDLRRAFCLAVALLAAPSAFAGTDRCDPAMGIAWSPTEETSGTLLFEDRWPTNGDLDFNDAVVAWHYAFLLDSVGNVVTIQTTFTALAAGATLHNGLYLHLPIQLSATAITVTDASGATILPVAGETDFVLNISGDTHELFTGSSSAYINTKPDEPVATPQPIAITINFDQGQPIDLSAAPFDVFIARESPDNIHQLQIHLPQYPGTASMDTSLFDTSDDRSLMVGTGENAAVGGEHFINEHGLPFVVAVPDPIAWPDEQIAIDEVYPLITGFGTSGGTLDKDWYSSGVVTTDAYTGSGATPAPSAATPAASTCTASYLGDSTCVDDGHLLVDTVNINDTCEYTPSPELEVGWLSQDLEYCTVTYACNTAFATYMFWHYSDDAPIPQPALGSDGHYLCDPAKTLQGCCENAPTIDEACQVDSHGACITITDSGGHVMCAGPSMSMP